MREVKLKVKGQGEVSAGKKKGKGDKTERLVQNSSPYPLFVPKETSKRM